MWNWGLCRFLPRSCFPALSISGQRWCSQEELRSGLDCGSCTMGCLFPFPQFVFSLTLGDGWGEDMGLMLGAGIFLVMKVYYSQWPSRYPSLGVSCSFHLICVVYAHVSCICMCVLDLCGVCMGLRNPQYIPQKRLCVRKSLRPMVCPGMCLSPAVQAFGVLEVSPNFNWF